jgi:hypothetical protein
LVNVGYGLGPVAVEFFWGSLKLPFSFLEVTNGRIDPRMLLRRGIGRSRDGSCRWLRGYGLGMEN